MKRGEVRYENADIANRYGIINSHRPVVIIGVGHGEAVQIIPLTTNKARLRGCCEKFHISITSSGKQSVALVEQVRTASASEISPAIVGECTKEEMQKIDLALAKLLGLPTRTSSDANEAAALNLRMIAKLADEAAKEIGV